jgi:hypothetical protein
MTRHHQVYGYRTCDDGHEAEPAPQAYDTGRAAETSTPIYYFWCGCQYGYLTMGFVKVCESHLQGSSNGR